MKKLLSIILSICMLLSITAGLNLTAYAEIYSGTCGDNVTWSLDTNTKMLTFNGTGEMWNYTYDNKSPWYSYLSYIETVIISDGVTSIGDYAFEDCYSLTSITIPDSVISIGYCAFDDCNLLTSIIIPNGVTFIGDCTFNCCYSLTSITIPNSVTSIGDYAFACCDSLTSIIIPNSVTSIGNGAFAGCNSLTSITIPNSVTSIGQYTFENCTSLTSITIPNSVTSIGYGAFIKCTSLNDIYYMGSESDWNNICIDGYDETLKNATIHYHNTHSWELQNTTEPACTCDGANYYACSVCGMEYKEVFSPAFGHTVVIDEAVPATCTLSGLTEGSHCSVCGEVLVAQRVVSAQHIIVADKAVPATCTQTGLTEGVHCLVCGEVFVAQEVVPVTEHKVVTDKAVSATCTKSGLTQGSHCSVCGEVFVAQKVVPATEHKKVVDKAVPATCTKSGLTEGSHCSVCGEVLVKQKTVAKKQHSYSVTKATTKKNGTIKCKSCGTKTTIYYPKTITLSKTTYVYDGKAKKPTVKVKDSKGKVIDASNYTVTYASGCKKVGKYAVTIKFKGNYSGSVTKYFIINPKGTKLKSLTSPSSGKVNAKWKKGSNISGYEIQFSSSDMFMSTSETKTISLTADKTSVGGKIKLNDSKNGKCYARIRTFKTVKDNGKKVTYYSDWSDVKSVKIKK